MTSVEVLRPSELAHADRQAWAAMIAAEPRFGNPLLTFDFAEAVAAVRTDAHVAVYRRSGRAVAFWAHHRSASGNGRPIGAPFSDYHALISEPDPGLTEPEVLSMAGLRRFQYSGLIDPWGVFEGPAATATGYRIDVEGGEQDVMAALRTRTPEHVKTWLKKERRFNREHREVTFDACNRSAADLQRVFAWKSRQLRSAGLHDVLSPLWVRTLMSDLHQRQGEGFGGVLSHSRGGGTGGGQLRCSRRPRLPLLDHQLRPGLRPLLPGSCYSFATCRPCPRSA
jgi:CelD/BcsL family acetyltransferase involved in cellulose biosynthesis